MNHCEVCDVELPLGNEAKELHESGKRHLKVKAQREAAMTLQELSVFLKWKTPWEGVSSNGLQETFQQFGAVDRVLIRSENNFAIVEFKDSTSARKALELKTLTVDGSTILSIEKRKVKFTEHQISKHNIDVEKEMEAMKAVGDSFIDQTDELMKRILVSTEEIQHRSSVLKQLEEQLGHYFINPQIKLFGSTITGVGTIDSDIDACLFVGRPTYADLDRDKFTLLTCDPRILTGRKVSSNELLRLSEADRVRFLCKIMNEVRKDCGWIGLQKPVLDARCPVVRFVAHKRLLIDLSVNNRLSCAKSLFLKVMISQDVSGNLKRLLIAFRFWAFSNGLFEPLTNQHTGHFNAYILNLLVIYFLIKTKALPCVRFGVREETADAWRLDFAVPQYTLANMDILQFFRAFFIHIIETPLVDMVYTPEDVILMEKQVFRDTFMNRPHMDGFKLGFLNIQDPLERSHNVAQNISEKSVSLMRQRMMFSLAAIKKSKDFVFTDILSLNAAPVSPNTCVLPETHFGVKLPEFKNTACLDSLKKVIRAVIEEVLLWELSPAEDTPSIKRMKLDDEPIFWESGTYTVRVPMWVGRRNVKRKIHQSSPSITGMELEKLVSQSIREGNQMSQNVVGKVTVVIEMRPDNTAFVGLRRLEGSLVEVTNGWHFLTTLISNNWDDIERHL